MFFPLTLVVVAVLASALPSRFGDVDVDELMFVDVSTLPESGQIVADPLLFGYDELSGDDHLSVFADPRWKNTVVNLHNTQRFHYGAGPLTWNDALYPGTLQWAQSCHFRHRQVFNAIDLACLLA
jgi:hypothetical protein